MLLSSNFHATIGFNMGTMVIHHNSELVPSTDHSGCFLPRLGCP
uniref:Uncharacterized protein n=1 Tax=Rhizophora mucronata TaxID=61149 RepID=A0A2P2P6I8_RHIMU